MIMIGGLEQHARELVQQHIGGVRLCDGITPAYIHSWRVGDLLKMHGFTEEVYIAGLLHDILEDSQMTLDQLRDLGYAPEILSLVALVTHDNAIDDHQQQRELLMHTLITAKNVSAWAIKLADIADNITEPVVDPEDPHSRSDYLTRTGGVYVYYGYKYLGTSSLYHEFLERYKAAIDRIYHYPFWAGRAA